MSTRHATLAFAITALLGGCAILSPPDSAQIRADALYGTELSAHWTADTPPSGKVGDNWLATFNDDQLDKLVVEALKRNPDLRTAAAQVEQSAAYAEIAQAQLLPSLSLLGTGGVNGNGGDLSSALSGLMLAVSWEPDLWGRLRYGRNAANEDYASAKADYEFARQSMAAQVARSWFLATETKLQLAAAQDMVQASGELVRLSEDRQRIGNGSNRDVSLARANLGNLQDGVRQASLAHEQALRSLELLVGRYPSAELEAASALADFPDPVPVGMPLEMLERRPDMIAAERRVAAAFDRVGEAKAAKLPSLPLNASVASVSSDVLTLAEDYENPSVAAGAKLLAPLYRGGELDANVSVRTAQQREALARYASQALKAIGDVENALATSKSLADRVGLLAQVLADQETTLKYEQELFRIGRQDLRAVQQQQMAVQAARMSLLRVQSEQLIQRVNLHLALGGSFAEPIEVATTEAE
ncbi:MAG TPA: efflux transporter outer membrane subunit [Xanthomonadales bacterium]|nr:efflux transporter outer membrane subunit [Xanthomonadales bacterium]